MVFQIADGSSHDILVADWVLVGGNGSVLQASGIYQVTGFAADGVNLQVIINGQASNLTASLVTAVWRKV